VRVPRLEAALGDHIDVQAEEVRQLELEPAEVGTADLFLHVNEEVAITPIDIPSSSDTAEDHDPDGLARACQLQDLVPVLVNKVAQRADTPRLPTQRDARASDFARLTRNLLTKGQATAGVSQQVRERGVGELGGVLVNAHLIRQLTARRTKRDDAKERRTTVAQRTTSIRTLLLPGRTIATFS